MNTSASHLLGLLLLTTLLAGCGKQSPADWPALPTDAVILAFGDSLTYGTGARRDSSYPAELQRLSQRQVINAGISGELSADGLARLPDLLNKHQPDLMILCHAGNDILRKKDEQQTATNLRRMIALAKERNVQVVMLGVPAFGLRMQTADFYDDIAADAGILYLPDLVSEVLAERRYKSDSVHPNAAGYKVMAEAIHAALRETGALP
ncbi:MAG: arylesterase [Gammaproteobacteria bacterium]